MKNTTYLIFVLLTVVLTALTTYLIILFKRLRLQKVWMLALEKESKKVGEGRLESIHSSLMIIAKATLQEQCEISEACVRVKNLLDLDSSFPAFSERADIESFFEKLKEFPYLDARNDLSKKELYVQDNKRFKYEDEHRELFLKSLDSLVSTLKEHSPHL